MKKTILKNGITLLTDHNPNATFFALSVVVKVGSFYEKNWSRGIAHFTEHMLFKGTKTRTYQDINTEVSRHGGDLNAMTTYDFTRYYTVVPYHKWELATDILSDMLFHSTIPEKELIKEQNVILDEIKMYEDDPSSFSQEKLQQHLFPEQVEYHNILGTLSSVKGITKTEVERFIKTYYIPSNMAFIATGNMDVSALTDILEQLEIPGLKERALPEHQFEKKQTQKQETFTYGKPVEQSSLSWGIFGPSPDDSDFFAYQLLNTLLGSYPNSRLYNVIREEKGMAYEVYMDECFVPKQSISYGYLGTDVDHIEEAKDLVLEEMEKVRTTLVGEQELSDLKTYIQGAYLIQLNEISFLNDYMMNCYLSDQYIDREAYLKRIGEVTAEEIQEAAKRYFKPENMIFVKVIPGD